MSVMVVTSLGEIIIDLFTDRCPLTCKNFLKLCKIKYYNGCLFHTVQKDFTAQTGDPTGTGSGGDSIYKYLYGDQARFFNDEIHPDLKHAKMGTVAMASAGENLNASQFYMTLRDDLDYLDEKHTVFGEVAEGHDTLMRINEAYVDEKGRPFKNIRIKHTYVLDDPFEDPPQLAGLIPDASPVGKPNEEVDDEVRLEDDWVPMDEQIPAEDLEEIIREKEAHSRAVVLETINDIPDADVKPPENVLFVCKLNPVTEDEDLHTIFSRFGTVTSAEVIRDYKTGDSLCYAFIEFDDKDACERAYFKMDNALIDDRRIHVDFSQSVSKLWNQFRRKGIQGKGCFKCGALDHIAKDCTGESTMPHQKFILKDDNQQRGGGKNANYEMVFDEEGSPQQGKRQRDNASGRSDYKPERLEPRVDQRAHLVNRDSSERDSQRRRIDEPGHDARKDDRDRKETKNGRSRDDRDVRETKHGHSKDDIDRTESKYERRTYEKDTRERRGDGERRSSDIDSNYKNDEISRRKGIPEPDSYRSRREERHNSKSHGDRHDEKVRDGRNEPRHRREMESDLQRSRREERDHRSPKSNSHRGGDERRRSDRR